jgi:hypothetical protein
MTQAAQPSGVVIVVVINIVLVMVIVIATLVVGVVVIMVANRMRHRCLVLEERILQEYDIFAGVNI